MKLTLLPLCLQAALAASSTRYLRGLSGSTASASSNNCYIHSGCSGSGAWSDDSSNSLGAGWYCTDGEPVSDTSDFDDCDDSMLNCPSGSAYFFDHAMGGLWFCDNEGGSDDDKSSDNSCFIHSGCNDPNYGAWSDDSSNSLGAGWYCTDGEPVDLNTAFDQCGPSMADCSSGASSFDTNSNQWICASGSGTDDGGTDDGGTDDGGTDDGAGGFEISTTSEQCVREKHPLFQKPHAVGATMGGGGGGGGKGYVCYQSCCVEHSSVIALDSGFVASEFDISCDSEWSACGHHPSQAGGSSKNNCFIHGGCSDKAGWSDGTDVNGDSDSLGKGWYCTDQQYVDGSTGFDTCGASLDDCSSGAAKYDGAKWVCDS